MELSTLLSRMMNRSGQTGKERVWVSLADKDGYFRDFDITSIQLDHIAGGIVLHIAPTEHQRGSGT